MRTFGLGNPLALLAAAFITPSDFGTPYASANDEPGEPGLAIVAGPLTIDISISRTAHLFHVVDQLAAWSPFCHAQYLRYFEGLDGGLSGEDRRMLARHADLRKLKGWGQGLEQTFYTRLGLDEALAEGIKQEYLTAEQAETERAVLGHFAPRIERLMREQAGKLAAFRERLMQDRGELAAFAEQVSRFFGGAKPSVPAYLIANPSEGNIGGGYNGGRLTIEIPTKSDAYPSFIHEIFHAFIETKRETLERAAEGVPGLDYQTLNEGLAYAIAPGIIRRKSGGGDSLARQVAADLAAGKPLDDDYARFNRFGLALRPLLEEALGDRTQTIETFLPRSVDAWKALREVSTAAELEKASGPARAREKSFSFGPGWEALASRMTERGIDLYARNHTLKHYQEIFPKVGRGDTLVLLFALDKPDRAIPEEYRDLLPIPWGEIEASLKRGEVRELVGSSRGFKVTLLAAPTKPGLEKLIKETVLLDR